ncbi:MAG: biotin/lipoyl-containing protein [Gemmatimonadales bacterium]
MTIAGREIEVVVDGARVSVNGKPSEATLTVIPSTPLRQLSVNGRPSELELETVGGGHWTVALGGERWEAEVVDERTRHIRSLTASAGAHRGTPPLKAPMPGLVLRVLVEPGQSVAAGTGAVVLEAMKMENELRATATAVISAVRVEPGQTVEKGQVLVEFRSEAT